MKNPHYYARLCWNSREWIEPTGEASRLESGNSYTRLHGFGHEEWLFRYRLIGGFQFGFLQSVQRSIEGLRGHKVDLTLWSIAPDRSRVIVGAIQNCLILSESDEARVSAIFRKEKWIQTMAQELKKLPNTDFAQLSEEVPFNVRFLPQDVRLFSKPYPKCEPNSIITNVKHYQLNATDSPFQFEPRRPRRVGTTTLPNVEQRNRSAIDATTISQPEAEIHAALQDLLNKQFGTRYQILRESDYVDLTVRNSERTVLIEIKSSPAAKTAIRQALGQILEYAYFEKGRIDKKKRLFIIAPGAKDSAIDRYIRFLTRKLKIPIQYCAFTSKSPLPNELRDFLDS